MRQTSADPRSAPAIEADFGSHPGDVRRHVSALADALRLATMAPLAALVKAVAFPDPARTRSTEDLIAMARRSSASGYHPSCTARMGPADDPGAVVDQYGRCHAVAGLVVADASIMPAIPRANTNLTSIMIGERIGEWLRTTPARYADC